MAREGVPGPVFVECPVDLLYDEALIRQWYADACTYVLKNKPWDLLIMRYHLPDTSWHSISAVMNPAAAKT